MKLKSLSSALLTASGAACIASSAHAAEWSANVEGYYALGVGYAQTDFSDPATDAAMNFDGLDGKSDGEIKFNARLVADNGLTFAAHVELETAGENIGDIDESWGSVSGSFGSIRIGQEDSVGYRQHYGAPSALYFTDDPENVAFLNNFIKYDQGTGASTTGISSSDLWKAPLGGTYVETLGRDDLKRVTYETPSFSGFQAGISYARDDDSGSSAQNMQGNCATPAFGMTYCDFFDLSVQYNGDVADGQKLGLSARYSTVDANGLDPNTENPELFAVGIRYEFDDWTIGASYADVSDGLNYDSSGDGSSFDVGVLKECDGGKKYSLTYNKGTKIDGEASTGPGISGEDESLETIMAAKSKPLATGIDGGLFLAYT